MVTQGNLLASNIIFLDDYFFPFFLKHVPSYFAFVLQVEIKAFKLFDAIIFYFLFVVRKVANMIFFFLHIYRNGG